MKPFAAVNYIRKGIGYDDYIKEYADQRGMNEEDDDDKIRLNQRKPSKYKGLRRFGPEKNLQRINKFMKKGLSFIKTLFR